MTIDELIHALENAKATLGSNAEILKRHVLDDGGTIVYKQINNIDVHTTSDGNVIVSL